MIFHPVKISPNYTFRFNQNFTEYNIRLKDGTKINGVLFKPDTSSKGLVFFLHGNAGNVTDWETAAHSYLESGYDFFVMDYPGFGKSSAHITNEQQILNAVVTAFDTIATGYHNRKIVITGFSFGTGPAAWLASQRRTIALILLAPYSQFADVVHKHYPLIPGFISKYTLKTYNYVQEVKTPVFIFHGDADYVIPYQSSLRLKKHLKAADELYILSGQEHNGITENKTYLKHLKLILNSL